jgi:hypothetical protein
MAQHRYSVGQTVLLTQSFLLAASRGEVYTITAILPERDNSPQYRIRSDDERHERVTTEDALEPVEI